MTETTDPLRVLARETAEKILATQARWMTSRGLFDALRASIRQEAQEVIEREIEAALRQAQQVQREKDVKPQRALTTDPDRIEMGPEWNIVKDLPRLKSLVEKLRCRAQLSIFGTSGHAWGAKREIDDAANEILAVLATLRSQEIP